MNPEVFTETVTVTPELATNWLERNLSNRPLSQRHVDSIASDIRSGNWELTHQGIAFNTHGVLVDGQHRLQAVITAAREIPMRVTHNVVADYSGPIDTGCMRRVAHILGVPQRLVSVCNALALLETGVGGRVTSSQVKDLQVRHRWGLDWALLAFPKQRSVTANVIAAHVFAYPVARDLVDQFAHHLTTYTAPDASAPVAMLRRHLERLEGFTVKDRLELTFVTLRALHAHCAGESVAKLQANDLGLQYFARRRAETGVSHG